MAADPMKFVDPMRKEILLANGAISAAGLGDLVVITFSQLSPRIQGVTAGLSQTTFDNVVVCRVALSRETAAQLRSIINNQERAAAPVAGNA